MCGVCEPFSFGRASFAMRPRQHSRAWPYRHVTTTQFSVSRRLPHSQHQPQPQHHRQQQSPLRHQHQPQQQRHRQQQSHLHRQPQSRWWEKRAMMERRGATRPRGTKARSPCCWVASTAWYDMIPPEDALWPSGGCWRSVGRKGCGRDQGKAITHHHRTTLAYEICCLYGRGRP